MTDKHLVFYDGNCGLCDRAVQFIMNYDNREEFIFAPLQGKTSEKLLQNIPDSIKTEDTLILIENWRTSTSRLHILGKGALRICWLLGGMLKMIGVFFWLPAWSVNWAYRLVARNRHRIFPKDRCILQTPKTRHRFLP